MSTREVLLRAAAIMLIFPVAGYRVAYHLDRDRKSRITAGLITTAIAGVLVAWFLAANL